MPILAPFRVRSNLPAGFANQFPARLLRTIGPSAVGVKPGRLRARCHGTQGKASISQPSSANLTSGHDPHRKSLFGDACWPSSSRELGGSLLMFVICHKLNASFSLRPLDDRKTTLAPSRGASRRDVPVATFEDFPLAWSDIRHDEVCNATIRQVDEQWTRRECQGHGATEGLRRRGQGARQGEASLPTLYPRKHALRHPTHDNLSLLPSTTSASQHCPL